MDPFPQSERFPLSGARLLASLAWPVLAAMLLSQSGCSLVVMTGRMLLGDLKQPSQFHDATHVDLAKADCKVLVLCSANETIRADYAAVEFDVLEGLIHRLKAHEIRKVVSPNAVAGWIDEHGGRFDDLQPIAEHFKAEYVIHIELTKFTCQEENSPNLLRGQAEGRVHAYKFDGTDSERRLVEVMTSDFNSKYPQGNPISVDKKSAKNFQQEFIDRVAMQLSLIFYDHPRSEEMQ
ncbi:MAG TPA: hypothetical protein VEI07_20830 [Planctomycetaceae bacterium]|nr:hypothetical protein [Planctomycetaceae bacterium]